MKENQVKTTKSAKDKFLVKFFTELANITKDIGSIFTFEAYLHRGRNHNLYWPDDHQRFKKGLHNLKQQGYIVSNKNKTFKFSKKGKEWYKINAYKYTPFREEEWDEKWRVVFFDIPEEFYNQRNNFRNYLKKLGFYPLQKSILAIPFKCENDVAEIANRLKIDQYIDIIVADSIGSKEEELKKVFDL